MRNASLTVQARALRRAADILGGKDQLRAALHVPMTSLEQWLDGRAVPPMDVFLKAVDIISSPTASYTPPPASSRARILANQSGELKRNSARMMARSREAREQSRNHESPKVSQFLQGLFGTHERSAMLESALDAAIDATHAQKGNIQLKDASGLHIVAYRGFEAPFLEFFTCVSGGHGAACGAAMATGTRVVVGDVANDPIFAGSEAASVMEQASARAVQSTPLVSVSGQFLGMLSTHFDHPHIPAAAELALVDRIVGRAAYWLEQATA